MLDLHGKRDTIFNITIANLSTQIEIGRLAGEWTQDLILEISSHLMGNHKAAISFDAAQ